MSANKYTNETTEALQKKSTSLKQLIYILLGFQIILLCVGIYLMVKNKSFIVIPIVLLPAIILPAFAGLSGSIKAIKEELKRREQSI